MKPLSPLQSFSIPPVKELMGSLTPPRTHSPSVTRSLSRLRSSCLTQEPSPATSPTPTARSSPAHAPPWTTASGRAGSGERTAATRCGSLSVTPQVITTCHDRNISRVCPRSVLCGPDQEIYQRCRPCQRRREDCNHALDQLRHQQSHLVSECILDV